MVKVFPEGDVNVKVHGDKKIGTWSCRKRRIVEWER